MDLLEGYREPTSGIEKEDQSVVQFYIKSYEVIEVIMQGKIFAQKLPASSLIC